MCCAAIYMIPYTMAVSWHVSIHVYGWPGANLGKAAWCDKTVRVCKSFSFWAKNPTHETSRMLFRDQLCRGYVGMLRCVCCCRARLTVKKS